MVISGWVQAWVGLMCWVEGGRGTGLLGTLWPLQISTSGAPGCQGQSHCPSCWGRGSEVLPVQ